MKKDQQPVYTQITEAKAQTTAVIFERIVKELTAKLDLTQLHS